MRECLDGSLDDWVSTVRTLALLATGAWDCGVWKVAHKFLRRCQCCAGMVGAGGFRKSVVV